MEQGARIPRIKRHRRSRNARRRAAALSLSYLVTCGTYGIPAYADQVVIVASKDTTLYETLAGSTSNGAGTAMFAGRNSQDLIRRALVWFDVAAIVPAGSTITSVQLSMDNDAANAEDAPVSLHLILADWGEGASQATGGQGSGAAAAPGDATWLHTFFDTEFWNQVGGDFAVSASASTIIGAAGAYTWGSTAEMVADVQGWFDDPAGNFGWCVVGNESAPSTAKRFATREAADPAQQPRLIVEYILPGVPAISEWGVVILALLLAVAGSLRILNRGVTVPSA